MENQCVALAEKADSILRCIPSNWADVYHPLAEFHERSPGEKLHPQKAYEHVDLPLERNVEIGNVMQDEIDQWFVLFFAQEIDEGLRGQGLPQLESCQTVLSERVIKLIQN